MVQAIEEDINCKFFEQGCWCNNSKQLLLLKQKGKGLIEFGLPLKKDMGEGNWV